MECDKDLSYVEFLQEVYDHFMDIAYELENGNNGHNLWINRKTLEKLTLQSLMRVREELAKERTKNDLRRFHAREVDKPVRGIGEGEPKLVEVIRQEIWRY